MLSEQRRVGCLTQCFRPIEVKMSRNLPSTAKLARGTLEDQPMDGKLKLATKMLLSVGYGWSRGMPSVWNSPGL